MASSTSNNPPRRAKLKAVGKPPSPVGFHDVRNTPKSDANLAERRAFPPLGFRDKRMEN
jgi:hypothetical protein